jgi:putative isomerase
MYDALQSGLATGWNTWWTRSMLAHVLMPQALCVNLSIKHYAHHTLTEALVYPPGEKNRPRIHPGLRREDGSYTELTLSWEGVVLEIQSAVDGEDLLLLITPQTIPVKTPVLLADMGFLWNRSGTSWREGDTIRSSLSHRLTLFPAGALVEEYDFPLRTPYLALALDQPVALCTGKRRTRETIQTCIAAQRPTAPRDEKSELKQVMLNSLAWNTIFEPTWNRVVTPVSRVWNTGWGGCVLFCWDTYFAAWMAAACGQKELAYANAMEITKRRTDEGFVPNFSGANGAKSWDRSQPPVGSLTFLHLFEQFGDRWVIEDVFDDLLAWNRWWIHARLTDGLLCWGSHPFNDHYRIGFRHEHNGVNKRLGAALESGLDNSPLYDDIPFDEQRHQLMLHDVGLNALYVADCDALSSLAAVLNRPEQEELKQRADRFRQTTHARLWCSSTGCYLNQRTDTGESSPRIAPTALYPLLADMPTPAQARQLVQAVFWNPDIMHGEWMLPSIARRDPAYADNNYWRGRIWPPFNFLAYLGLRRAGFHTECRELAGKSKRLLLHEWRTHGHVHENYNADTGQGCDVPNSDPFYHWGGLLAWIALDDARRTSECLSFNRASGEAAHK